MLLLQAHWLVASVPRLQAIVTLRTAFLIILHNLWAVERLLLLGHWLLLRQVRPRASLPALGPHYLFVGKWVVECVKLIRATYTSTHHILLSLSQLVLWCTKLRWTLQQLRLLLAVWLPLIHLCFVPLVHSDAKSTIYRLLVEVYGSNSSSSCCRIRNIRLLYHLRRTLIELSIMT